jgi:hypothetical protein
VLLHTGFPTEEILQNSSDVSWGEETGMGYANTAVMCGREKYDAIMKTGAAKNSQELC